MIKYIHGSEDSIDVDVLCVFEKMPSSIQKCKLYCSEDPTENRNIIVIKDGVVTECFKGTPDEVNNALYRTYSLHKQDYPLLVTREVERDLTIKIIRAMRIILSHISRSEFRAEVKYGLSHGFNERIEALTLVNFAFIDYRNLNHNMTKYDILKTIAFQMGQTLALIHGVELYTKKEVAEYYPTLKPFLYRRGDVRMEDLNDFKESLLLHIKNVITCNEDGSEITDGITTYNIKTEKKI